MAGRKIKITLISIAILVLTGGAVGYYLYNKGPRDIRMANGIKVKAEELYLIYTTDSTEAKKKYTDKIVQVTGEITDISSNLQQQKVVLLKTASESAHINCTLEIADENLRAGEIITLKGIASGMGQGDEELGIPGDVYLIRCHINKTSK